MIARAMLRTRIRFFARKRGFCDRGNALSSRWFFPHVVRSGVPLHRGKLQLKLSLIVHYYPKKKRKQASKQKITYTYKSKERKKENKRKKRESKNKKSAKVSSIARFARTFILHVFRMTH